MNTTNTITKTFTAYTVVALWSPLASAFSGPLSHPKYLDDARLWRLVSHVNRQR